MDTRGRVVATLLDRTIPAGTRTVTWNGHDATGLAVASGVYLARLETDLGLQTVKLVLAR
jgi:hypothetical protein